ncbi:hypothetical protein ACMX2H_15970 [Arthrobacter sulfonylureivorans]|uniref:hypothetical protein n=1 Tax=Arthrobacter sulfonylureivorans TaxID=2486855 RepID=UPI0039E3AE84
MSAIPGEGEVWPVPEDAPAHLIVHDNARMLTGCICGKYGMTDEYRAVLKREAPDVLDDWRVSALLHEITENDKARKAIDQ